MQTNSTKNKKDQESCPDYPIVGHCKLAKQHPYCDMLCPMNKTVRDNIIYNSNDNSNAEKII